MMFRVGMEVVCVDDSPSMYGRPVPLVLNRVYTVSGIDRRCCKNSSFGVFLADLPDTEDALHYGSFRPSRFRPAVKRKTDISIFTKMLEEEEHHGLV